MSFSVLRFVLVTSVSRSTVRSKVLCKPPTPHITAPVPPLHLTVLALHSFSFRSIGPRQPSRFNLVDPDIVLGIVLCFLSLQALSLLSFDQWPDACVLLRLLVVSLSPSNR